MREVRALQARDKMVIHFLVGEQMRNSFRVRRWRPMLWMQPLWGWLGRDYIVTPRLARLTPLGSVS